jgi:lysozyme family protein
MDSNHTDAERFAACLKHILRHEGGYADHPQDPGGATNMGITRKTLARWRKISPWWHLSKAQVRDMGQKEASAIYEALYWGPVRGSLLPKGLDLVLFDFAVNSGPQRAIKTLQGLLKVVADGQAGPITLKALQERVRLQGPGELIEALCNQRLSFLARLSSFAVFGKGWKARVGAIRLAALLMAGAPPQNIVSQPLWRQIMEWLSGYKTYIMGAFMLLAGLAQLAGLDLPALDGQSAGHLIMEALAVMFLRKGIKSEIGNA